MAHMQVYMRCFRKAGSALATDSLLKLQEPLMLWMPHWPCTEYSIDSV